MTARRGRRLTVGQRVGVGVVTYVAGFLAFFAHRRLAGLDWGSAAVTALGTLAACTAAALCWVELRDHEGRDRLRWVGGLVVAVACSLAFRFVG